MNDHLAADPMVDYPQYLPASVTLEEAHKAYEEWGANCGPGALAAVLNKTLEDVRPHLIGFELKRYTNPTMMLRALRELGVRWTSPEVGWPKNGLVRVQWGGPWMREGVPMRARYRHTHWIATRLDHGYVRIFDINGACAGWMSLSEWEYQLVPWLLKQVAPKNDGTWTATHRLEIEP
jgi:hypothetical protein